MKNEKLLNILLELGLSENESRGYLAALSLGSWTILELARAACVKRTTVYSVLDALLQKGLMAVDVQGLKKEYMAESPEKLELMVEQHKTVLKRALPELLGLYNLKSGQSLIKYYQGMEGVKVAYDGLLDDIKPHDDFMVITDQQRFMNLDQEYFTKFITRRRKMNIEMRLLLQDSPIARVQQREHMPREQIKILPKKDPLTTDLVIIPTKVIILELTPPITTLVIESKNVVQLHKELFEIIWRSI